MRLFEISRFKFSFCEKLEKPIDIPSQKYQKTRNKCESNK